MILENDGTQRKKSIRLFSILATLALAIVGTVTTYAANDKTPDMNEMGHKVIAANKESLKSEQTPESGQNTSQVRRNLQVTTSKVTLEVEDLRLPFDTETSFSISHTALAVGGQTNSDSVYKISSGDILIYTANWSSLGQNIQIGFVSKDNLSKQYWKETKSSGSATGTIDTEGVPVGEYYVAIGAPDTNTETISVVGTFEWKSK
ncbi:hypothetical protein [Paenibacillus sp. GCM10027626]|uniref:hypothetical protein n=1 Tax=Paenibacillus sp. GCM10027626 TaxID=3273411 RepID=UPI003640BDD2